MIRFSSSAVTAAGRLLKKSNSQESVKNIRLQWYRLLVGKDGGWKGWGRLGVVGRCSLIW